MNSLKLYKNALIRVLFPLALAFAVLLVLFALDILRVGDMSDYFELVTIAAILAAAFFTVKEIFSLSVSCGASRKTSFAAILFSAVTIALIITAFFIIMSRLETMGRIINLGVIEILFVANIAGGMFTPYLSAPIMSYGFFESVFGIFGPQAFTIAYILLTILAIAVSFAFYRRKPIKNKRSV